MTLRLDKRFWTITTGIILVFTVFVVGRNLLHAVKIRRQIGVLRTRTHALPRKDRPRQHPHRAAALRRLPGTVRPRALPHAAARRTRLHPQKISGRRQAHATAGLFIRRPSTPCRAFVAWHAAYGPACAPPAAAPPRAAARQRRPAAAQPRAAARSAPMKSGCSAHRFSVRSHSSRACARNEGRSLSMSFR